MFGIQFRLTSWATSLCAPMLICMTLVNENCLCELALCSEDVWGSRGACCDTELNMGNTFILRSIMHVKTRVPRNLAQTAILLNCALDKPVVI